MVYLKTNSDFKSHINFKKMKIENKIKKNKK